MKKEKYSITGMTCSACSSRVEKCVSELEGAEEVSVNLLTNSMVINYDESRLRCEDIIKAVEDAGYGAEVYGSSSDKKSDDKSKINFKEKEIAEMKQRLIWSFIFLIPMMYISMAHMMHHMFKIPIPQFMNNTFYGNENAVIFAFSQFLLLIPIMYLNRKYY